MKLFYRKLGQGQPLIILHGLFGQSDNWNSLGKQFSEFFEVYLVDQRNHGLSPHSEEWNYQAMSADLLELINDNNLQNVILLGHSMGGKTVMQFALEHTSYLSKVIVADIAPKYYPVHHQKIIEGLSAVDFKVVKTRKEAEAQLSQYITDFGTKQFLLKNIYWKDDGKLAWRFNLEVISSNIEEVGNTFDMNVKPCEVTALFVRGEKSNYVLDSDVEAIQQFFPNSELKTIVNAGHWVHAEQPQAFFDCVMEFINP